MTRRFAYLFRRIPLSKIQSDHESPHGGGLLRELGVIDLTALGIAAIVGAGIFSTIGNAAYTGGPAVVFLFVFTAIACGFSALCYAEFASRIPVAGSAYTYAYASFGELIAWIIGWDLLMEYAIGNIAVAISWSDYFSGLLDGYGLHIPEYLRMDYLTASRGAARISEALAGGQTLETIKANAELANLIPAYTAWTKAPLIAGTHLVANVPAFAITVLITALVYVGIRESKRASNIMVGLKLAVILLVIAAGAFYVNPANWRPFAPNGISGVLKGVSGVFFAYIGFDAISTTAEECRDPQRDLPRGMMLSLLVCTVLYVLVALVLTGMVKHTKLQVGDPLAFVFGPEGANLRWVNGVVAASAVIAMATVLLVFQLGQPRIWMAMSRDGLLPPIFSAIHPKYHTPWFSTILTGIVVAVPSLFTNLVEMTDLTSIGTLFAFILVSGGVLFLEKDGGGAPGKFRIPFIGGRYLVPALLLLSAATLFVFQREAAWAAINLSGELAPKIPLWIFIVFALVIGWLSFRKNLSLIPVLGLLTCGYLMTELGITNWLRFGIWLVVGLFCYFLYGRKHSRLGNILPS